MSDTQGPLEDGEPELEPAPKDGPSHEPEPLSIESVLRHVRQYLDLRAGEERFVIAALAVATSRALTGEEPTWAQLIAPSGAGKTEAIKLLDLVTDKRVDELTRAGLLSWSPGAKSRRVGLLTTIPAEALVTISDLSTVATMGDREARSRMYALLRVVYDGYVFRGIGGQPAADGQQLEWSGHLTLLAAATSAIDAASSFETALGERWLTLRLPESSAKRARERARFVTERRETAEHRQAAQETVARLVTLARTRIPESLPASFVEQLIDVATFAAAARTGVMHEGQGRGRVVVGIPSVEEPTRLVGQLGRLARCAVALGLEYSDALTLATSAARDSIPVPRVRALRAIAEADGVGATVSDVLRGLERGSRWQALWTLDELDAIGLVRVEGLSRDEDPSALRRYHVGRRVASVGLSLPLSPK
jgi:hypothetical protein